MSGDKPTASNDARTSEADVPEEEKQTHATADERVGQTGTQEEQEQTAEINAEEAPGPTEASLDGDAEAALAQARAEAAANYDRFLRAAAELDNFRKRTAKLRTETREDTLRDVLLKIAPVLDNLNRALAQDESDAEALRQGVELIRTQLMDVLAGYGLRPIESVGQAFDPNLHEALLEVDSDEHAPGTVVEETETGYMLNKKVVKPARVIVSKSGE